MESQVQTLNLPGILSESKRIINAHSRHFLALSVIFLLPVSFFITIYPTLQSSLDHHTNLSNIKLLIQLNHYTPPPFKTLIAPIVFFIFIAILSICAIGTITYSTYHGFYGRPVKLGSAIKSLIRSFIPLVFTSIAALCFVCFIVVVFGFGFYLLGKAAGFLGFNVKCGSDCYNWLMLFVVIALVLVLIYLQVHCLLCYVIVVVESKWGFEPLQRSGILIKGMRSVSLWLLLFVFIMVVFPLWLNSVPLVRFSGSFDMWKNGGFIVQTVLSSSFVTLFMLITISANTVLYMYCKALHGELAAEIAEEFAREYVSLPFDDEKVPHIVTVVQG